MWSGNETTSIPGADVGEGGGFVVGIFHEWLVLSRDCPNPLKLHIYSLSLC